MDRPVLVDATDEVSDEVDEVACPQLCGVDTATWRRALLLLLEGMDTVIRDAAAVLVSMDDDSRILFHAAASSSTACSHVASF